MSNNKIPSNFPRLYGGKLSDVFNYSDFVQQVASVGDLSNYANLYNVNVFENLNIFQAITVQSINNISSTVIGYLSNVTSDIQGQFNSINTDITTINGEIVTIDNNIQTNLNSINTINSEITTIDSNIQANLNSINTLNTNVSQNTSDIQNIENNIVKNLTYDSINNVSDFNDYLQCNDSFSVNNNVNCGNICNVSNQINTNQVNTIKLKTNDFNCLNSITTKNLKINNIPINDTGIYLYAYNRNNNYISIPLQNSMLSSSLNLSIINLNAEIIIKPNYRIDLIDSTFNVVSSFSNTTNTTIYFQSVQTSSFLYKINIYYNNILI